MAISADLARDVRARARGRCQYCMMHESLQGATFHIEHIIPRCRGGNTDLGNIALACPNCNLHKAARVTGTDPLTGIQVQLFHPVAHNWGTHFWITEYRIEGLTEIGRATVALLEFNHPRRLRIREVEEVFGLFPPRP